ncbi:type II toxin-antitoxin system HipA family toxin [soil metagenome]
MARIETIVFVYLAGAAVPAGRLVMVDEPRARFSTFTYGRRYLERPDRIPIDPVQLPLPEPGRDVEIRTQEDFALFNGIRDAAPDGWGQYLMYKAMGDRLPTDADLILASGDHRVGALAFGPTPQRPMRFTPWGDGDAPGEQFDLGALAEAVERVQYVDGLNPDLRTLLMAGSSIGGARPKAVTEIDGQAWIAKFPSRSDTYPECRIELATMRLAAECGLDVPHLDFTSILGRDIYLIRRFDRQRTGDRLERTAFASGLTMLGAHEADRGRFGYQDLADALRRYGADPRRDLRELWRRMLFNVLVTNDDDHLRNHGFLLGAAGWRLSPLYDVVPKPQVGHERTLVLRVGPQGRAATVANAVAGAAAFHLTREDAESEAAAMAAKVWNRWDALYAEAGVSKADRGRFATCFRQAEEAVDRETAR